ncbi:MAG TPA: branched-chain amino acid ABC transporter substrate-binding protein [Candidatus Eremiobacteraceae bacterium]|jgi:branched-chain amino acid transport system substrate-binding protein|nr:branched-chain amino acid ABC transporter substrate-binding protein [Candidatus Eremiobacteraceae bacterium]
MRCYIIARYVSIAAVVALTSAALAGCTGNAPSGTSGGGSVVRIGSDLPVSGGDASDGVPTANGVKLAVIDANKRHLIPGFTIVASIVDDAVNGVHNPSQGAKNIQAFASDSAVLGVVGPFNSNVAKAEIPLSNSLGIALVSPANTNPDLTKGPLAAQLRTTNPNDITYFRVCTTDDIQGPAGADYAAQVVKLKRAYVLDDNETYGKGVADQWAAQFQKDGGTVLGHDHITKGQQDFHALLTRAASLSPDVVFYGGTTSTGGGLVRKQMADAGLGNIAYFGADGVRNDQFLTDAGAAANGSYATVATVNATKIPAAQTFLKEYQAQFGVPVGSYSANGYVAAMTIIEATAAAMKDTSGALPTRAQVLDQLRSGKVHHSIIGDFSFDANGDTTNKIISIYGVRNGGWVFLSQKNYAKLSPR